MDDLISRQAAIDAIFGRSHEIIKMRIGNLPSAWPESKTGRWIRRPYDGIYCTACGKGWSFMLGAPGDVEENYRYCPHCGAVMMEGEADG